MASTAPTSLASWRLESAVEPFFSGGAVAALPDGRALTACGDEVKVRRIRWKQGRGVAFFLTNQQKNVGLANGPPPFSNSHHYSLVLIRTHFSDRQRQYGSCRVHARRGELDWESEMIEGKRPRQKKNCSCKASRRMPLPPSPPPLTSSLSSPPSTPKKNLSL